MLPDAENNANYVILKTRFVIVELLLLTYCTLSIVQIVKHIIEMLFYEFLSIVLPQQISKSDVNLQVFDFINKTLLRDSVQ